LIYRIALDGKNNQYLEIYGLEHDIEKLQGMVEEQFNKGCYIRRKWKINSY